MRQRPKISLVVFDLDNTVYDWLGMWHSSFTAMLAEIVRISGLSQTELEPHIREVFQRHGTSEFSFLLQELEILQELHSGEDVPALYKTAIQAYSEARGKHLQPFPGTLEAMRVLKSQGVKLAAYTESLGWFAQSRVKALGLDGLLDRVYSPPDHEIPPEVDLDIVRHRRSDEYELTFTEHHLIERGLIKPNADVLRSIVRDMGGTPTSTCYVGDSLMKDILMAQDAGLHDVLVDYGSGHTRPEYEQLRRVSHWTEEDVERERQLLERGTVTATTTLHNTLAEIFMFFDFRAGSTDQIHLEQAMTAWRTSIDVQMHFNDIELRVRNFAITVLAALVSAAAVALQVNRVVDLGTIRIPLAVLFLGAAFIAWMAFYFMDRVWYHPLLKGAVKQAEDLERYIESEIPDIGLTQRISKSSPVRLFKIEIHSALKMTIFYVGIALMIIGLAVGTFYLAADEDQALVGTLESGETICGTTVGEGWVVNSADGRAYPLSSFADLESVDSCP